MGIHIITETSVENYKRDSGPSEVGHEMHAKMEEAAQHALSIINSAHKFLDDAEKEQSRYHNPNKFDIEPQSVGKASAGADSYKKPY